MPLCKSWSTCLPGIRRLGWIVPLAKTRLRGSASLDACQEVILRGQDETKALPAQREQAIMQGPRSFLAPVVQLLATGRHLNFQRELSLNRRAAPVNRAAASARRRARRLRGSRLAHLKLLKPLRVHLPPEPLTWSRSKRQLNPSMVARSKRRQNRLAFTGAPPARQS